MSFFFFIIRKIAYFIEWPRKCAQIRIDFTKCKTFRLEKVFPFVKNQLYNIYFPYACLISFDIGVHALIRIKSIDFSGTLAQEREREREFMQNDDIERKKKMRRKRQPNKSDTQ